MMKKTFQKIHYIFFCIFLLCSLFSFFFLLKRNLPKNIYSYSRTKKKYFKTSTSDQNKGRQNLKQISESFSSSSKETEELVFLFSYLEDWNLFTLSETPPSIWLLWGKINNFLEEEGWDSEDKNFIQKLELEKKTKLKNIITRILNLTLLYFLVKDKNWSKIKTQKVQNIVLSEKKILDLNKIPLTFDEEKLKVENAVNAALFDELEKFYEMKPENNSLLQTLNNLLKKGLNDWNIFLRKYKIFQNYFPKLKIIKMEKLSFFDDDSKEWKINLTKFKTLNQRTTSQFFLDNYQALRVLRAKEWEEYFIQIINNKFAPFKNLFLQFIPKLQILDIDFFVVNKTIKLQIKELNKIVATTKKFNDFKSKGFVYLPLPALKELNQWISSPLNTKNIESALKKTLDDKFANKWKILKKYLDTLNVLYIDSMPIPKIDSEGNLLPIKDSFFLSPFFLFSDRDLYSLSPEVFKEFKKIITSDDKLMQEWLEQTINQSILPEWLQVRRVFDALQKEKKPILKKIYNSNNEDVNLSNLFDKRKKEQAYELNSEDIEELKKLQGLNTKEMKSLFSGAFFYPPKNKKALTEGFYHFLIPVLAITLLFIFFAALFLNRVKKIKKLN